MSEIELNSLFNNFILWYHAPNDKDWGLSSYKKVITYDTIEKYWHFSNDLNTNIITNGMFFLMKEGINPIWEDLQNIEGGCVSIKNSKEDSYNLWNLLSVFLLSNNLTNNINGISISPKKNFNIVKIWFNEKIDYKEYKFPEELKINNTNFLFRIHKMNIEKDKFKNR